MITELLVFSAAIGVFLLDEKKTLRVVPPTSVALIQEKEIKNFFDYVKQDKDKFNILIKELEKYNQEIEKDFKRYKK